MAEYVVAEDFYGKKEFVAMRTSMNFEGMKTVNKEIR